MITAHCVADLPQLLAAMLRARIRTRIQARKAAQKTGPDSSLSDPVKWSPPSDSNR